MLMEILPVVSRGLVELVTQLTGPPDTMTAPGERRRIRAVLGCLWLIVLVLGPTAAAVYLADPTQFVGSPVMSAVAWGFAALGILVTRHLPYWITSHALVCGSQISAFSLCATAPAEFYGTSASLFISPLVMSAILLRQRGVVLHALLAMCALALSGWSVGVEFISLRLSMLAMTFATLNVVAVAYFVSRDRADLQRTVEQLSHARDAAQAADRAKSRFLESVGHEIRTPMNGILGLGSILATSAESAADREVASALNRSSERMMALLEDVLDYAEMNVDTPSLCPTECDLDDLLREAVEDLHRSAPYDVVLRVHQPVGRSVVDRSWVSRMVKLAARHVGRHNESGRIVVQAYREAGNLCLMTTGHGPFDPGRAGFDVSFQLCRGMAERVGGEVVRRTGPAHASQVLVRIPLAGWSGSVRPGRY